MLVEPNTLERLSEPVETAVNIGHDQVAADGVRRVAIDSKGMRESLEIGNERRHVAQLGSK